MIFAFLLLLKPALECVEGGKWWHFWAVLPAWFLDVFIAHTTWALVFGWPKHYEMTISHTLERIVKDHAHPRRLLAIEFARQINAISPTGQHIKGVV
jgi:hypothetical protein